MASSDLSEEDLQETAAEAGLSPNELRIVLAERRGGPVAGRGSRLSPVGPPRRGVSVIQVEGRLNMEREEALAAVRSSIERQTGKRGHKQGDSEADIVDEDNGVTYRLRTAEDGAGGSLVRIDIDPSQGKGTQALVTTGVFGVTATLVAMGWLFGATVLWLVGLGFGAIGGLVIARSIVNLHRASGSAHSIAAQALMEAEDRSMDAARP